MLECDFCHSTKSVEISMEDIGKADKIKEATVEGRWSEWVVQEKHTFCCVYCYEEYGLS